MIYVILVGFAMITLGVALLMLGEVPFLAGKRISALRARLIGAVLVLFLPMALAARLACNLIFDEVDGLVVTWVLCGVCWCLVFAILFRVVVAKKEARANKPAKSIEPAKSNPFVEEPVELELQEEPAPKPVAKKVSPVKKAAKPKVDDENPFDFS